MLEKLANLSLQECLQMYVTMATLRRKNTASNRHIVVLRRRSSSSKAGESVPTSLDVCEKACVSGTHGHTEAPSVTLVVTVTRSVFLLPPRNLKLTAIGET